MPYWREPGDGSLPDPETRCQFFELGRLICLFFTNRIQWLLNLARKT
jgi:hypothetical protein